MILSWIRNFIWYRFQNVKQNIKNLLEVLAMSQISPNWHSQQQILQLKLKMPRWARSYLSQFIKISFKHRMVYLLGRIRRSRGNPPETQTRSMTTLTSNQKVLAEPPVLASSTARRWWSLYRKRRRCLYWSRGTNQTNIPDLTRKTINCQIPIKRLKMWNKFNFLPKSRIRAF